MPAPWRSNLGLLVVGLGTIAAPLDTAVNIAFPSITHAFALEVEDIRWVVIAYVLTYASLMLIFGKLGDLLGYRHIFQLGLLVSAAGFAACSLAPTYGLLLLGRVLQGIGIALTLSCAPALATSLFEERERTRVLGTYAAIAAAGSALGPLVGGLLVERWDWNAVFWFRAPLVLVGLGPVGPHSRGAQARLGARLRRGRRRPARDWMSALLLAFSVPAANFGSRRCALGLALLALVGFVAFLIRESRHAEPIIRPSLFRDIDFAIMNAASIAVYLRHVQRASPGALLSREDSGPRRRRRRPRARHRRRRHGRRLLARGPTGRAYKGRPAGARRRRAVHRRALGRLHMDARNRTRRHGPVAPPSGRRRWPVPGCLYRSRHRDAADRGPRRCRQSAMVTRTLGVVGGATGLSAAFATSRRRHCRRARARPMPSSWVSNRPSSTPPRGSRSVWR